MPIPKYDGSPESEWISSCMKEIGGEYEQAQALAICYKQMEMSAEELAVEDTSELPEPKEGEQRHEYILRCIPTIYKEGGEYDQRTATAMCADRYENSNTLLKKETKMSNDPMNRVARNIRLFFSEVAGADISMADGLEDACWEGYIAIGTKELDGKTVPNCVPVAEEASKVMEAKGVELADYPWDECIADMTDRYESEETAKKVCGWIKANYGS